MTRKKESVESMNIKDMTEQEKSIMLARLCGWDLEAFEGTLFKSLYNPHNMMLAWRVLNWACGEDKPLTYPASFDKMENIFLPFDRWWSNIVITQSSPTEAQAAWLDKILELAIEAGMVELI